MNSNKIINNIAVTIDFDKPMLANGMQQNIIFLADCINQIRDKRCFLLYVGSLPNYELVDKNLCISYSDYFAKKIVSFDLIIYAGFTPGQKNHLIDKDRNKTTKFVCILYGSELADAIFYSLDNNFQKIAREDVSPIDQIWTSPHHKRNIPFLQTKFKNKNVKIAPFIWDSTFILKQFKDLKLKKSFEEFKSSIDINRVTIFEPNISFIKTSLVPLFIVERFEQECPNLIKSCSLICGHELIKSKYFPSLISNLDIYNKRSNFIKCYKRFPLLYSIKKLGGLIVSNQIFCELNYLYLETLFLSLPLVHNSVYFKDYGYYYKEFDIKKASKNLSDILQRHRLDINTYDEKNKELFIKYSPRAIHNVNNYKNLIDKI